MTFGILVIGPAGVGKTQLCRCLQEFGDVQQRGIYVVNLDPAAETLPYRCDVDIRELITVEDAMTELKFGPNGGLVYCMEYLITHIHWLEDKLLEFGADDTLLFDCPGQSELFTHVPVMSRLVRSMTQSWHISMCSAYLVDAVALHEPSKFLAGALAGLSAMLNIPLPRVTVLTKADLVQPKEALDEFLEMGSASLYLDRCEHYDDRSPNHGFRKLTRAICEVLDDHSLLSYVPFSIRDEEAPQSVLTFADQLTQYTDEAEVRIPRDHFLDEDEDPDATFGRLIKNDYYAP